jgi:hypothetical protein
VQWLDTNQSIIELEQAYQYLGIAAPYLELIEEMTAKEYLASGKPQGTSAPSPKKEMTAKEYLASGKPTKSSVIKTPEGYTKRSLGGGAVDFRPTDKAREYLDKTK